MQVRRVTITLPPRMKPTAVRDARLIAEAVSGRLGPDAAKALSVQVQGHGRSGPVLAQQVAAGLPKPPGGRS